MSATINGWQCPYPSTVGKNVNKIFILTVVACAISLPLMPRGRDTAEPVEMATKLYSGCLIGSIHGVWDADAPDEKDNVAFFRQLDENCTDWAHIWFKASSGYSIWRRPDVHIRFVLNRYEIFSIVETEIIEGRNSDNQDNR